MEIYVYIFFLCRAATVHIPKPPAHKSSKAIAARKAEAKKKEAEVCLIFNEKLVVVFDVEIRKQDIS